MCRPVLQYWSVLPLSRWFHVAGWKRDSFSSQLLTKRWRIWLRIRRGNLPVCISSLTCGLLFTTRKISILTPVLLKRWRVIISFRKCRMIGVGLSYVTLSFSHIKVFFNYIKFLERKNYEMLHLIINIGIRYYSLKVDQKQSDLFHEICFVGTETQLL